MRNVLIRPTLAGQQLGSGFQIQVFFLPSIASSAWLDDTGSVADRIDGPDFFVVDVAGTKARPSVRVRVELAAALAPAFA